MGSAQRNPSSFAAARAVILPKTSRIVVRIACPVERTDAKPDHAMEGRMRPISCARNMAVLDRIEMNVIHMLFEIGVVAQRVLPVAPLPDAALAFADAAR